MMNSIKIQTLKRGVIELNFSNFHDFVWVAGHQIGILRGYIDDTEEYLDSVSKVLSKRFQEKESLGAFDNLTAESVIVDIGSGVGIIDIALYKYINGGKFILVDESIIDHNHVVSHWSDKHGFYNDWNVFKDIATHSNVNLSNFDLVSPGSGWGDDVDLIMSNHSYLWHYPLEVYIDEIKNRKSALLFDILNRPENNMQRIMEIRNQECEYISMDPFKFHWFSSELLLEDNSAGKICYWR